MKLRHSITLFVILSILLTACDITVNLQSTPVADANGTFAATPIFGDE